MSDTATRAPRGSEALKESWKKRRIKNCESIQPLEVIVDDQVSRARELLDAPQDCCQCGEMGCPSLLVEVSREVLWDLADEVDRLREESDEYAAMMDRLGELLAGVANALNGPPPELTSWSYHDLPKKAADAMAEVERLRALTTIDDAMVERAARASLSVTDPDRTHIGKRMRAALEAVLGVES